MRPVAALKDSTNDEGKRRGKGGKEKRKGGSGEDLEKAARIGNGNRLPDPVTCESDGRCNRRHSPGREASPRNQIPTMYGTNNGTSRCRSMPA